MTDHTQTLITEALHRQADRAPDPSTVLFRLERTQPAGNARRHVLVGAAAAVVLLLVAVAFVATGRQSGPVQAGSAKTGPAQTAAITPAKPVNGMRYQPHWLPAHTVELVRSAVGQSTTRTWIDGMIDGEGNAVGSPGVSVSVRPGHLPVGGTPVNIGDKPAKETTSDLDVKVTWESEPGVLVTVAASLWPDKAQIAERVANSVRPDDTARFEPQLRFGKLPAGWTDAGAKVFGSASVPANTGVTARTTYQGHEFVMTIGRLPTGHYGLVSALRDGTRTYFAALPGKPGGTTHVPGWPDFAALIKAVQVDKHADVSWIGTR